MSVREGLWIARLTKEILSLEDLPLIKIFIDSTGAIALSSRKMLSKYTKHIELRWYFIRECLEGGLVKIIHCPTNQNCADALTKPLGKILFRQHRDEFKMHYG
jgi:hypothetical protein